MLKYSRRHGECCEKPLNAGTGPVFVKNLEGSPIFTSGRLLAEMMMIFTTAYELKL